MRKKSKERIHEGGQLHMARRIRSSAQGSRNEGMASKHAVGIAVSGAIRQDMKTIWG